MERHNDYEVSDVSFNSWFSSGKYMDNTLNYDIINISTFIPN
jgi:hypothetical protein